MKTKAKAKDYKTFAPSSDSFNDDSLSKNIIESAKEAANINETLSITIQNYSTKDGVNNSINDQDLQIEGIKSPLLEIHFNNCIITKALYLTGSELKLVKFSNSEINHCFVCNLNTEEFVIEETTFKSGFNCNRLEIKNSFEISNSSIYPMTQSYPPGKWSFILEDCNVEQLIINNYQTESFVNSSKSETFGSILFNNGNFKSVKIKDVKFVNETQARLNKTQSLPDIFIEKSIKILNVKDITDFTLENIDVNEFFLDEKSSIKTIAISDSILCNISISTSNLEKMNIRDISINDTFRLSHRTLDKFLGTIRNLSASVIFFSDFENNGKLTIENIFKHASKKSVLRFNASDLGEAKIVGCDFQNEWEVEFRNSSIVNTKLIGTQFPTRLESYSLIEGENNAYRYQALKDIFNQLDTIYRSNNDQVNARTYQSYALDSWTNILYGKIIKGFKFRDIADFILLYLGYCVSYFGNDFMRCILVILFLEPIMFAVYLTSLGFNLDVSWNGICFSLDLFSYILDFLNPLHRPDFLAYDYQIEVTNLPRFLNGFFRLINIYLIYQFARTSRKFSS